MSALGLLEQMTTDWGGFKLLVLFSHILEVRSLRSRRQQSRCLLEPLKENPSHALLLASGSCWQSLVFFSLQMEHSSLHLISVSPSPLRLLSFCFLFNRDTCPCWI